MCSATDNEVVVASDPIIEQLPDSIESIFIVDCKPGQENLHYSGRTSASCAEAHRRGKAMHQKYLDTYDLTAAQFPLLILLPDDWDEPFGTVYSTGT